jgi:hypothetical protein
MIIQNIKAACVNCKYYNLSSIEQKFGERADDHDGWCSHSKINGRHYKFECAYLGVQPDCPFLKGNVWTPEILINK